MLKGGLGGMMKKAQEMQEKMQRVQEELARKTVQGQAGAGAVQVMLNGHYGCTGVAISEEALNEDREMLEALLAAAFNDATQKVRQMTQEDMAAVTGGLNLPGGMKLPF